MTNYENEGMLWFSGNRLERMRAADRKVYEYESVIYAAGETGGAYVIFPYDIREKFDGDGLRYMPRLTGSRMMAAL